MSKTPTSNFGNLPEYSALSRNSLAAGSSGLSVITLDTAAATTATLLPSQIKAGVILHTGTSAINVTTPTATEIAALCGNSVGNSIQYHHRKAGTGSATYVGGSGVTLVDSPIIAVTSTKSILCVVTAMKPPAVSVYQL